MSDDNRQPHGAGGFTAGEPLQVFPGRHIDPAGRCCGRKPIPYKRDGYLFCPRCDAAFDIATGAQKANWAWLRQDDGFTPRYPNSQAVDLARTAISLAQTGEKVDG